MILKRSLIAMMIMMAAGCQTSQQAREIKLLSFDEDASKGKGGGMIEGSDCVFHVLGYWLGGQPTLARAVLNARRGKSSGIGDSMSSDEGVGKGEIRYFNNMSVVHDGFNAGIFGKNCINISATGYK
jgi:hypothetical protein